jgi:hypothetical protein
MYRAAYIMKALNVIEVIVAVIIIALAGIATIVAAAASLLVQSASATTDDVMTATTSVGGGEQESVSSTNTTNTTTNNASNALLGPLFSYGEGEGIEANVNPINETYSVVSYSGNRIIVLPNNTGVINATEIGNFTIHIQPNGLSINQGQAVIMTNEDGAATEGEGENATITFVLLTRTNPDGSGNGTGVTYFSTNSTGQLAFLNNMVGIMQTEFSSEGGTIRTWEWKGGTLPFEIDSSGDAATTGNQTNITSALE